MALRGGAGLDVGYLIFDDEIARCFNLIDNTKEISLDSGFRTAFYNPFKQSSPVLRS